LFRPGHRALACERSLPRLLAILSVMEILQTPSLEVTTT
jgi:hypothetical protein